MYKTINEIYDNFQEILKYTEDCRILVVEDDKELNSNIVDILEPFFGNRVTSSYNGEDALEKYKQAFENDSKFDIIITDIKMPYKNGIELAYDVKQIYESQDIIVITAFDDSDQLIDLIDLNINKFILKPDIFEKLLVEIMKISAGIHESKMLQLFIQKREEACKYSVCSLLPDDRFSIFIYAKDDRQINTYQSYLAKLCNMFYVENNVDKSIEILESKKASLILVDIEKDDSQGYELAKQISINSNLCRIPIIFLSGVDIKRELIESGYRLGAVDWIIKNSNYSYVLFNRVRIYEELFLRKQELKAINDNLEKIVEEQTQKLKYINSTLEDRVKEEVDKNRQKDTIMFQQAKLASMGEMIANIAHQWRQPITAVSAILQGINFKNQSNKASVDYINEQTLIATDIIKKMSETINDFRDFFRPNKNKEDFSFKKVIDKDLAFLKIIFEKNSILLFNNIQEECKINSFKGEFTQVIMNILTNAKDAFLTKEIESKLVVIDAIYKNNEIQISIQDNAGGIPEDIISKVFEPYFTTKHKSQGTGIGLYMSKEIIEKHMDGRISVKNKHFVHDGHTYFGANFTIKLYKGEL
jgi:signal transduction histidine kinase/ActR/RegA family two-component response regulator